MVLSADTETEGQLLFIIKFVLPFFFRIINLKRKFVPTFVKIRKMNGRLRNYVYFRVQNTILISTEPRRPVKIYCLDVIVSHLLNKCHLSACYVPSHRASHQDLSSSQDSHGPPPIMKLQSGAVFRVIPNP